MLGYLPWLAGTHADNEVKKMDETIWFLSDQG
jgi:hypothetical protein